MTLSIDALGPVAILEDGRALKLPKKARGLLVYLAMQENGFPVGRNKLADLLWPHQDSKHALHSLRNCLLDVKKSCGRAIDADLTSCGFTASIDVKRFTAFARSDDRQDLETALTLYRGELLEDFDVVSEPWREWQASERECLREIAIHVAQRLTRLAYVAGDHELAIRAGRRAVHLDEFNESSQRALMQAYAGAEQRSAAIRQYENFRRLMYAELGALPEDETRSLRDQIRRPIPRSARLQSFDKLHEVAAKFASALEGRTKLSRNQVLESVVAMAAAADDGYALAGELETRRQPDVPQPIAA